MAVIDQYFKYLVEAGGSDLHLSEGQPPKVRVNGTISAISDENLEGQAFKNLLAEICDPQAFQKYLEEGDLDFAYEMDETSRFRCNYFKQQHGLGAVFRLIPTKIATLEELGVPTVVKEFAHMRSGLVLVTGPTGSGKSTTLAAIIDYINSNQARHIITVEEPIEFVHPNKKSIVTQREVPLQTPSFADGLRASLREDSDIVLVGEMRDLETISLALTAAETGLLVFGMLIDNGLKGLEDLFNGLKEFRLVLVALFNLLQDFLNVRVHCSTSKYNNAFFVMRAAQFGFTPRIKLIINLRYTNVKLIVCL